MIYEQLYEYLSNYLNGLLCDFCKAHSIQRALSRLIESLKKELENSGLVGAILMDLSKAHDCLPHDLLIAKWLNLNSLIANPEKFHFMIIQKSLCLTTGPINLEESDHVELLEITIDKHLDFKKHIESLCWNANYKLHAPRRMRKYLAVEKAKLLGNAFIDY